MFTCGDVGVLEAMFFHELEEYAVVHSSEGAFEFRVGCVYVTFGNLCVFVHHDLRGEAIVYIFVRAESICGVAKDSFGFRYLGSSAS